MRLDLLELHGADLIVTDLGRVSRLTIVERDRVQALLDEIQRSGTGQGDSATALRSGNRFKAGPTFRRSRNRSRERLT